ncbi:translocation/assembly module TamB domain-containing protein [Legionella dresdenensis]|uniref:Translocation/assembly module TamB domain-containing protein n=1 Tax=Legionella dresdenensis TaxID=450200 RepID=A0ABV8CEE0_9GAMM
MMRILLSILRSLGFAALLLLLLAVSSAFFLLATTSGMNTAVRVAKHFLPGKLEITALQGRLINQIAIKHLTYRDKTIELELNDFALNWNIRALLHKQLEINRVTAQKIHLQLAGSGGESESSQLPHLPVKIVISQTQINELAMIYNQSPIIVNNVSLAALLTNKNWQIEHLKLAAFNQLLDLKVNLQPAFPFQLQAQLDIKPFSDRQPAMTGQLTAEGNYLHYQWHGKLATPHNLVLDGELNNGSQLAAHAEWNQLHWPLANKEEINSKQGQLDINGTLPDLTINFSGALSTPVVTDWQLNAQTSSNGIQMKSRINLPQGKVMLQAGFNHVPKPELNIQASLGNNHLEITGSPDNVLTLKANLPTLRLFVPALKELQTTITADGRFNQARQQGNLNLSISKGSFKLPEHPALTFEGGKLNANLRANLLTATANLTIDSTKKLTATIKLPDFQLSNPTAAHQKIEGTIDLSIDSLAFVQQLNDLINQAQGKLHLNLSATGTLAKPVLMGSIELVNAALSIPRAGINLNPVQFTLHSQDKQWQADGSVSSNGQKLTINGQGSFFPIVKGTLTVRGVSIPVSNTPEYSLYISPDLTLEFEPGLLKARGNIIVPKALIKPQTFTSSVSMTDDVVYTSNNTNEQTDNPLNIDTDIHVEMGNDVLLAVKGLQGALIGGLQLRQLPGGPLNASGELNVREGKYQAYGQDLTITEGQLLFTGGLVTNPGIHVRATRQFNNTTTSFSGSEQLFDFHSSNLQTIDFGDKTTVGIEVTGRLRAPKVKLFSMPPTLSQADILSMLLLGKPASQANQAGGQLLLAAVSALNLDSGSNGTQLLGQLKQSLGIDLNLQNNQQYNQKTNQSTDSTALVVGKSLSKRIYASYNIGISQTDSNVFTLRYLLNKFFSIQVTASMTGSGLDVLYTRQKD